MVIECELKQNIYGLIYEKSFLARNNLRVTGRVILNREKSPEDKRSGAIQTINVTMLNRRSEHHFYRHALAVGADRLDRAAVGFGDCQSDREADTGAAGLRVSGAVGAVEAVE